MADTLTPQRAAVLLALTLIKTSNPDEVQQYFDEYYLLAAAEQFARHQLAVIPPTTDWTSRAGIQIHFYETDYLSKWTECVNTAALLASYRKRNGRGQE